MNHIIHVSGREILDSRGIPTVEARVVLSDGSVGQAAVPSGKSTGTKEACELRDAVPERFAGLGTQKAVSQINGPIFNHLKGREALDQLAIDRLLCQLDGTENKSHLGANALLAVSLAVAKAAAENENLPLYAYIARLHGRNLNGDYWLPTPMINVINGGQHVNNGLDIQEFMLVPWGAPSFKEALRQSCEIFYQLKSILQDASFSTAVGDEGGFAPALPNNESAFSYLRAAVEKSGGSISKEIGFAVDCAANGWWNADQREYVLSGDRLRYSSEALTSYFEQLSNRYPLISIEDGYDEEDWNGFIAQTKRLGDRLQIVGDDLFVTSPSRLLKGISLGAANAILIKLNQIGTLSETLTTIRVAQLAGYGVIVSHRSGETEDTTLVDLAVGTGALQIKTGSLSRSERVAKYNRLLQIEEELGARARYAGLKPFERFQGLGK